MRVVVIDDEELPRRHLASMLSRYPDLKIAAEAANGLEALEVIAAQQPDVIFLDIEMPGLDGFGVLQNLHETPRVVFVTAYDKYAVRAFEANAVDYLLKPVQPERLEETLGRVRAVLDGRTDRDTRVVERLIREIRPDPPNRIAARKGRRIVLIPVRTVLWAGVEDRLAFLHTATERYMTDRTLGELENMLGPAGFFRISRGEVVNTEHIRELIPWSSGTWRVCLTNGTELAVSRERARDLKALVGL